MSGVNLEKIIQINYRIPVPSTSLALRLVNGYLDKSRTSRLFDDSMKNVTITGPGPASLAIDGGCTTCSSLAGAHTDGVTVFTVGRHDEDQDGD